MNEKARNKKYSKVHIKKIKIILIFLLLIILITAISIKDINSKETSEKDNMTTVKTNKEDNKQKEMSELEKAFLSRDGEKLESLPILMYHFFYDESAGETGRDSNWMEISAFEEQMRYLSENDYYFPSWDEVYEFVNGLGDLPIRSIVVTIDDGDPTFFRLAEPILRKYNVKATSFVITSWIGEEAINELKSNILNFQSHSHNMHRPGTDGQGAFLTMTYDEAYEDLETSKSILDSNEAFCYPFGHVSEFTSQMLTETGYKVAVTTQPGRVTKGQDPLRLTRVRMSQGDTLNEFINRVK